MNYVKSYAAGALLPTILLPLIVFGLLVFENVEILTFPFVVAVPMIWGLWNVLYQAWFKQVLPGSDGVRYLVAGAVLGLILASIAVFWFDVPEIVGVPHRFLYAPLITAPVAYALIWRFVVKPLTDAF